MLPVATAICNIRPSFLKIVVELQEKSVTTDILLLMAVGKPSELSIISPFKPTIMIKQFTFILCALGGTVYGQTTDACQKIGFANVQLIAQQLPETKQMEAELASLGGQLQNQLNAKYSAYNQKVRDFENPPVAADEASLQKSRDELVRLEHEIRKFASDAEATFQKKQEDLMRPILSRISHSVNEVAHENHYDIILDAELPVGQRLILFGVKEYDVSELVLKKMGVSINQHKR
jgi:outer membrane protein